MKKLLTIFSSFGIVMSSTLSIISCVKTKIKKTIDKVSEQLKDQVINIIVNDGNENSIKNVIKTNSEVIAKFAGWKVKIVSFEFIKNGSKFQSIFQNNEEYEVILKIEKENSKQEKK